MNVAAIVRDPAIPASSPLNSVAGVHIYMRTLAESHSLNK